MSKKDNNPSNGSDWKQKGSNAQSVKINDSDNSGDVIRFDSGGQMPPGKRVTESYSHSISSRKVERKPK